LLGGLLSYELEDLAVVVATWRDLMAHAPDDLALADALRGRLT
jgi:hypothetical protein